MALTKHELEQWLSYEPATGVFRWIRDIGSIKAGDVAGGKSDHGYRRLCLQKKFYAEHRLAWLAVHGVWPSHEIDHINGARDDNRIVNLRDVPRVVNLQNMRTRSDNSVGLAGVRRDKVSGNFRAQIRHNGTTIQLGAFDTADGAHAAYVEAKREMHIGFVPERMNDPEAISGAYGADQLPKVRLTAEDVANIKTLLSNGVLQEQIASKFSISQTTVSNIRTGKRWTNTNAGESHADT
ncbi:HNH endonuclease [Acidovorax soli]|uniref:HNH endonuclease n=1 Tax=Acidovorax soli TaxID=592050 RepID=UPI0032B2040B